jgi:hypothetical protein
MLGCGTVRSNVSKSSTNRRSVNAWEEYEKMYIPFIHALRSNASLPVEKQAVERFDMVLSLPSKFNGANVGGDGVEVAHQCGTEKAYEALDELRHHLQVRMCTSSKIGLHVDKPQIAAH